MTLDRLRVSDFRVEIGGEPVGVVAAGVVAAGAGNLQHAVRLASQGRQARDERNEEGAVLRVEGNVQENVVLDRRNQRFHRTGVAGRELLYLGSAGL